MNKRNLPLVAAALLLGMGAGGIQALRREPPQASAPAAETKAATLTPAGVLAAIPPPRGTGLTDRAVAAGIAQARRNTKDDKAWVGLGDALMQKVRESADQGYYGHAERAYGQALALNPRNGEAMTGLAWVTGGRHEFGRSVEWAEKAVALDPRNHAALGLLGDAAVELGDYDAALEHYQRMLDIRPDLSSYSRGAHLLFLTGDTRKALWLMTKAVESGAPYAENTAWCRAQLARMLFDTGALLPAEQVLKDALKRTPGNRHVLTAMGRVRAARGDHAGAIGYYKKAIALAPEHEALVALGDLLRLTGRKDEAEAQYALVEKLHQRSHAGGGVPHGHMQLAQFYADHDRNLTEALRMARERRDSRNVFDADTLAWCRYKNGQYALAKEAIARALRLGTPDARIHFHAGMIYAKLGDRAAARKHLHRALSLNPHFSPVHAPLATATLNRMSQVARTTAR